MGLSRGKEFGTRQPPSRAMSQMKPLDEIPSARVRRVLGRLRIPDASTIAWLGAAVAIFVAGLLLVGILVGGPAAEMFQSYFDKIRSWAEP